MTNVASLRPNRRLTARRACRLTVSYRSDHAWHPATAMDLSLHGCRLRLGEDLARGAAVTVQLESPAGEGGSPLQVAVSGSVIWSRLEGLSYQAGIHFAMAPDALEGIFAALAEPPGSSSAE